MSKTIAINVPSLTRVEGEGALKLEIQDGKINDLALKIYEPPRYFEQFLIGHDGNQVIDMVARICGICPVAYQMSAVLAIEDCFDVIVSDWVQKMRQVIYCGEWIQSHSLHIHLLALPDYFGFDNALEMAKDYPDIVTRGMLLQSLGNKLVALLGKRSVHPIGVCIGGFYYAPSCKEVKELVEQLKEGIEKAYELIDFLTTIVRPTHSQELVCVCLNDGNDYTIMNGEITSNQGFLANVDEFEANFNEFQVPYSTALHCLFKNEPYLVGPLARININGKKLPNKLQRYMTIPTDNVFDSALARAIETAYALELALSHLTYYEFTNSPNTAYEAKAGIGYGASEAPRGLLWHRYQMDDEGKVLACNIVPPTSQNQAHIEKDLRQSLEEFGLDKPPEEIRLHAEMVIRNYDPCISCSTHFLDLTIDEKN
jgi:coenzyme F420-reducing hydrogenase alpha subunit